MPTLVCPECGACEGEDELECPFCGAETVATDDSDATATKDSGPC